ncbi:hypothetical protein MJO28_004270 [Puccinia striiformis f. sp. tritici]|uniref:Uncharacterized protein n=1 Tax=Puccinia striiformis f. sp. tritici TaxID=168172 RepID=A0ACC0EQ04_9BASI|nr:hypothetical protein MJO28_004270 [Puccinia striiformis f. sp. tritici]
MPASKIALVSLILFPCALSHAIDPSVVPTSLLHLQRRGIDQNTLLENGKEAQKLNAKFTTLGPDSTCQTGDMACIAGAFSQCVGGKYVGGPCAQPLKCFAMPLLLKKGTTLGCDSEADATTRISNTGATGGLTGTGSSGNVTATPSNSTQASPAPAQKATHGSSVDPDEDGPDVAMPDDTSAGVTKDASEVSSSKAPANASETTGSSNESSSEKDDDSYDTTAESKTAPFQSIPSKSNSTHSTADKPKQVDATLDLDEMNITGP